MPKSILIITTNVADSEDGKIKDNGVYLEEFAIPYLIFKDTGFEIAVASPKGGLSPVDENSLNCSNPAQWDECIKILRETQKLADVDYKNFDAIFFPGGHGPLFDLSHDKLVKEIVEYFYKHNKIISAICHGSAALLLAKDSKEDSILKDKKVTSFTNEEEKIAKYKDLVPFSVEDRLKALNADFVEEKPWSDHVEVDGNIITGQNPQSATSLAEKVIKKLSN